MANTDSIAKDARLNMRLTSEALETIREAASLAQQDVTSFVLGAALDRARTLLAEERILRLSPQDIITLEAMLAREPRVVPELAALLDRHGHPARNRANRSDHTKE